MAAGGCARCSAVRLGRDMREPRFSRSLRGLSGLGCVEVIVKSFGLNKHHRKDIFWGKTPQFSSRRCAMSPQDGSKCSKHNSSTNNTFKMSSRL